MRFPRAWSGWLAGPLVIVGLTMMVTGGAQAAAVPGQQGIDTSLPATDSQVTVNGRGTFANLAITVNQTTHLSNQAVSITWTGGTPTVNGPGRFGAQFLQIYQCWGDDDGTNSANPGPPPQQCEAGAYGATPTGAPLSLFADGLVFGRVISRVGWANYDANVGTTDVNGQAWLPFRAVDGKEVAEQIDPNYNPFLGGNYWLNPYFNSITTNEVPGAVTHADGKGAELFQVLTGNESSGLGCGKKTQPVAGGSSKVPKCWIVVVPRGDKATENAGTPMITRGDTASVSTSPLSPSAWQNRVAIPIEFNPVDSPCQFADVERRIAGSEMAVPAVANWQPTLCETGTLPPFSYAPVADATARSLVSSGAEGGPGMAVVSRPLDASRLGPDNPAVYAPLSLSGLVIGFNVERYPAVDAPPEMNDIIGVRVANINLTPRLVAKLLTQSYAAQVSIVLPPPNYPWLTKNPYNLGLDPDFLRFNPEFKLLYISQGRTFSGLQLPAGNSDAATQVWEWVLADPEARAWLEGQPDEWGMVVNPYYNAKADANPSKFSFYDPIPPSFPKADPYCYQAPGQGPAGSVIPPPLCGTDWMPYSRGFGAAAQVTRAASDAARVSPNASAESSGQVWKPVLPQNIGERAMLALTDTPSAAQYGLQMASLSRAGDNGDGRQFIAPTGDAIAKGAATMKERAVPGFLEPDPTADAPGAYPLTSLTYAAMTPLKLDSQARSDYAAFIEFATGSGQVPGLGFGQLPRGYTPLTDQLKAQATGAADEVRTLTATPTATTTTTTVAPSAAAPPSGVQPVTTIRRRTTTTPSGTTTSTAAPEAATTVPPTDSVAATDETTTVVTSPASSVAAPSTPAVPMSTNRLALPGLGLVAMGSALGALEITKRPRRGGALSGLEAGLPAEGGPT
jgi:hypothetical protein